MKWTSRGRVSTAVLGALMALPIGGLGAIAIARPAGADVTAPPGQPTMVSAMAGDGMASVSFMPGDPGGSMMVTYSVSCSSSAMGAMTGSATTMSMGVMVGGLTNGDMYTCTVTPSNEMGPGPVSAASNMFTPMAPTAMAPDAPTMVMAMAGNAMASVSFAPGSDGGSPIMQYNASCMSSDGGMSGSMSAMGSPIMVGGLSNGHMYACTVSATNGVGTGPASMASNMFMPAMPMSVPSAPMTASGAAGNGRATLRWTAPTSNGGATITGYLVIPYVGYVAQPAQQFNTTATTEVVSGLKNGTTYRFKVAARNMMGEGPASLVTNAVTVGVPAPTAAKATRVAKGSLRVTFTAPADNGAAITSYTAACAPSNGGATRTKKGNASPITVTGLTPGKTYTCTVRATNSRGTGPPSSPSSALTA